MRLHPREETPPCASCERSPSPASPRSPPSRCRRSRRSTSRCKPAGRLRARRLGRHRRAPARRPHEGRAEAAGRGREPARRRRPSRRRGDEERARRRQRADADADRRHGARADGVLEAAVRPARRLRAGRAGRQLPVRARRSTPTHPAQVDEGAGRLVQGQPDEGELRQPGAGQPAALLRRDDRQAAPRRPRPRAVQRRRADDERADGRSAQRRRSTPSSSRSSCTAAGKVRILATSGAKRSPLLPDVPTFGEGGPARPSRARLVRGLRAGEDAGGDGAPAQRGDQQGARERPSCASASPSSASSRPAERRPTWARGWRRTPRAGRRSSRPRGSAPTERRGGRAARQSAAIQPSTRIDVDRQAVAIAPRRDRRLHQAEHGIEPIAARVVDQRRAQRSRRSASAKPSRLAPASRPATIASRARAAIVERAVLVRAALDQLVREPTRVRLERDARADRRRGAGAGSSRRRRSGARCLRSTSARPARSASASGSSRSLAMPRRCGDGEAARPPVGHCPTVDERAPGHSRRAASTRPSRSLGGVRAERVRVDERARQPEREIEAAEPRTGRAQPGLERGERRRLRRPRRRRGARRRGGRSRP